MARMTVLLAVLAALATAVLVSGQGAQQRALCALRRAVDFRHGMCRPAFPVLRLSALVMTPWAPALALRRVSGRRL